MINPLTPPLIPNFFKTIGFALLGLSIISLVLFLIFSTNFETTDGSTFGMQNANCFIILKIEFIVSLFLVLFSKEKIEDERITQFKLVQLSHGILYVTIMHVMGLIATYFSGKATVYDDASMLIIAALLYSLVSFYLKKKHF